MKIAVITLPLHTNYGGILQAYALKRYLEDSGHEVTVLDMKDKMPLPRWWKAPYIYMKRYLLRIVKGPEASEVFRELRFRREYPVISSGTAEFVSGYISPRMVGSYREIRKDEYDAYVVGSDQVWRPRYFGHIEDAFLEFTRDWDVKRVSYAASFGTDSLETDYEQTQRCSRLLSKFDAVSVREESGADICREWLDCDRAVHVLDPVMLLDKEVYMSLSSSVREHPGKGKIVTYLLDPSAQKMHVAEHMSGTSGMGIHVMNVNDDRTLPPQERVVPPVEQWIAGFRDAGFIVTDSFHGCVLSILFHKPFIVVGNDSRGLSRIHSLLGLFGLEMRLVHGIDPEDDGQFFLTPPDWKAVDDVLGKERNKSGKFLEGALPKA